MIRYNRILFLFLTLFLTINVVKAEDGYDLWLRYSKCSNVILKEKYKEQLQALVVLDSSETLDATSYEIGMGLHKMLDYQISRNKSKEYNNILLLGKLQSPLVAQLLGNKKQAVIGNDGFLIQKIKNGNKHYTIIAGNTDIGILYGAFRFLELLQCHESIADISLADAPKVQYRVLNHWDNLDGTIERGYAGYSLWDWQRLPGIKMKRYVDYARANASIGINGSVLNNVNSSVRSLTKDYLVKAAALADVFRPYGIKVYLTAKFSAPKELGHLKTADPLDPQVVQWWKDKVEEIYKYIPDFGGFLIKANSEGQPGPGDYGRSHADGANMLAKVLKPKGGVVMWRTFVYENHPNEDRAAQGYQEFQPLDGKFDSNVLLQAKYGPIDFQPREAFNPLYGAMPNTNLDLEVQITQEYFGFGTHLVYLGPLFQEYLRMNTYHQGGSIADIITGKNISKQLTGIAGVANIGTDINWCGHPFAQSNWYAFGKYAWNPYVDADTVARRWLQLTYTDDRQFLDSMTSVMMHSRESAVNYMVPLGLNHIMNLATHYGPGPWGKIPGWNSWDYHHADSVGLGLDRTSSGFNTTNQYASYWRDKLNNSETTPVELILWFHHIGWDKKLVTGNTLWEELVSRYYKGADDVLQMKKTWSRFAGKIDVDRFSYVNQLLDQQYKEAVWWRDGCVLYFQQYSKKPIPFNLPVPEHKLDYYEKILFP